MCLGDTSLFLHVLFDPPGRIRTYMSGLIVPRDHPTLKFQGILTEQQSPLYLWGPRTPSWSQCVPWCWILSQVPHLIGWHSEVPHQSRCTGSSMWSEHSLSDAKLRSSWSCQCPTENQRQSQGLKSILEAQVTSRL